ncbi:UNVERIFIED_CONTAM: hypothetical protein RMT77_008273 [Armadillidium vulgare]
MTKIYGIVLLLLTVLSFEICHCKHLPPFRYGNCPTTYKHGCREDLPVIDECVTDENCKIPGEACCFDGCHSYCTTIWGVGDQQPDFVNV